MATERSVNRVKARVQHHERLFATLRTLACVVSSRESKRGTYEAKLKLSSLYGKFIYPPQK